MEWNRTSLSQQREHLDSSSPLISEDGAIDDVMLEVIVIVCEYSRRGCPPTQLKPDKDRLYLHMVKQHDEHGRLRGVKVKAVWGSRSELIARSGKSTACIEHSNLTSHLFMHA